MKHSIKKRTTSLLAGIFLATSMASLPAFAASRITSSTVEDVRVDASGIGMIYFADEATNRPGCVHSQYTKALSFDARTEGGQLFYSIALAAKSSGALVTARGKETCIEFPNVVQSALYLTLH